MSVIKVAPPHIRAIAPYQPGKPISELARELSLEESSIIKLASNENPLGVSPRAQESIRAVLADLGEQRAERGMGHRAVVQGDDVVAGPPAEPDRGPGRPVPGAAVGRRASAQG